MLERQTETSVISSGPDRSLNALLVFIPCGGVNKYFFARCSFFFDIRRYIVCIYIYYSNVVLFCFNVVLF